MKKILLTLLMLCLVTGTIAADRQTGTFECGKGTFLLNGKPFVVRAAEVHYPRIPQPYWEHRIRMCKALGMNTICIYVFWNFHEPRQDQFCFTGQADVAAFCRLAQRHGLYVIVRPGPYVCAEWEMGGLPWWLLKKKDIRLRERDPFFMERVRLFEQKVAEQLAPLTIQQGGPIIMIQVENEYGSYGEDKPYISDIRDCLRSLYGDRMALFQCDWSSNFTKNGLDDLVWTMNFGTGANIDQQFRRLGELRPDAPKMCSEFWSGWFDKWGARHETRPAKDMVAGIDEMLSKGISFSLYMTHGGTSFGHWAGANSPGFAPDVTSYDYDAPINEYGQATEKYWLLRETIQKYADRRLPSVPKAPAPIISVPKFKLTEFRNILCGVQRTVSNHNVLNMESLDMGWGSMVYRTKLPATTAPALLTLYDCHDFARVFIDGVFIGQIDRVQNEQSLMLPKLRAGQQLTLLVEAMGRINFGRAIKDFKGITDHVTLRTQQDGHELTYNLKQWDMSLIPDDYSVARQAFERQQKLDARELCGQQAGYYRGEFTLRKTGDTFLNFESWGKGQVWVNGHAMGRIWSIGPQQTLYVPGCWLKKGRNEIIVLDVVGPREAVVWGQQTPELNKLQITKPNLHDNAADKPDLSALQPVAQGQFGAGNGWQTVPFAQPQEGRYLVVECLSAHQSKDPRIAIAELYLQDASGRRLSRESWVTKYADSEDAGGNHTGDKAFDLQESTYWQTVKGRKLPHLLVIDLGSRQTVRALEYLPRAEQGAPGSVKDYRIFLY